MCASWFSFALCMSFLSPYKVSTSVFVSWSSLRLCLCLLLIPSTTVLRTMISAIYIFSVKGELLLQRVYAPPGPPHPHLKALARSLMANRAFGEFAPVICVGRGNSSAGASESPAGISSFTWFMPPRAGVGGAGSFPSLALSATSSPVSNNGTASAAAPSSAAYFRHGTRRRYGGASIDENGVIYVAALHQNANVACALEVLRRLAALVQAFFTAAYHAGGDVGGSSLHPPSDISRVSSPAGTAYRFQRGVSVGAYAAGKRNADTDAADAAARAKTPPSSWQKMRRGLSLPREPAAAGKESKETMRTEGVLMPAAPVSPLVSSDYTYGAAIDGSSRGDGGGSVTEMFIRKNFVLLHELLDEAVDGGYPQLLDLTALKQFIFLGSSRGVGSQVGSQLPAWAADLLGTGSGAGSSQPVAGGAAFGRSGTGPFGSLSLRRGGDRSMGALQDVLQSRRITSQITSACAWRPPGIKYRSNEVFVDVLECVNVLISQNGVVLRADVNGQVIINCKLSGMPECKFGLNDKFVGAGEGTNYNSSGNAALENSSAATMRRHTHTQQQTRPSSLSASAKQVSGQTADHAAVVGSAGSSGTGRGQKNDAHQQQHTEPKRPGGVVLDDCRFHQCVRLAKYDSERVVTFIPPDGVFQLMSYRVTEGVSLPFKIFPLLQERSETRMECMVLLKALFPKNLTATNVEYRSLLIAEIFAYVLHMAFREDVAMPSRRVSAFLGTVLWSGDNVDIDDTTVDCISSLQETALSVDFEEDGGTLNVVAALDLQDVDEGPVQQDKDVAPYQPQLLRLEETQPRCKTPSGPELGLWAAPAVSAAFACNMHHTKAGVATAVAAAPLALLQHQHPHQHPQEQAL
eukprot:XP_028343923.1 uncharacterized protein LOC112062892 [Physeter catodon]